MTINARELRISNLVNIKSHADGVGISAKGIDDFYKGKLDVTPIPLTEEWLLNFGYTEKDLEDGKILVVGESFDNVIGYIIKDLNRSIVIKSVHQLQNLYFALTGQELELNKTALPITETIS